ncbi:MAG: carboxypeptidase regulatory-like domain-containing protein [Bacteroidia bacterium]
MKTLKQFMLIIATIVSLQAKSNILMPGTGEIRGLVKDENHDPAIGAIIHVTAGGVEIAKAVADINGKYVVKPLQPGYYDLLVQQIGYRTLTVKKIEVEADEASYVDVDLVPNTLDVVNITAEKEWTKPIVDVSVITMHQINSIELNHMALTKGDIIGAISNISSDVKVTDDGKDIYSRGARAGTSEYFVDGEKLINNAGFVGMGIQSLSVITGGIPAQYGDLTGGAIIVTSKDYFSGLAEKRMRQSDFKHRQEQLAKDKKDEEDKKNRQKEIEEEKKKEKENKSE